MRFEVEMRFVRDGQVLARGGAMIEANSKDVLDTLTEVLRDAVEAGEIARAEQERRTYVLDLDVLRQDRAEENPWTIHETPLVSVA